ncbi:hypothetical protein KEM48_006532 [Puccinia striiformis f. sp. tritici PST-130]|nr:hypothetical protein KEM48_006532 [Puccinia striiformis f. sp. tritici PST-130]
MPNIPRSPNGQFSCQPLIKLRILASLLRHPSWTSHTSVSNAEVVTLVLLSITRIFSNRIIDDDKEEEVCSENLDGQE